MVMKKEQMPIEIHVLIDKELSVMEFGIAATPVAERSLPRSNLI